MAFEPVLEAALLKDYLGYWTPYSSLLSSSTSDSSSSSETVSDELLPGFKPDAIAYFLVIMSDQLLSVKYCSLGLSSNIIREASNLLSAVLIDDSKIENDLDIEKEAIKLDKKMTKIRKTIYHRSTNLNKYINFLIDLYEFLDEFVHEFI